MNSAASCFGICARAAAASCQCSRVTSSWMGPVGTNHPLSRRLFPFRLKAVADPGIGENVLRRVIGLNLLAQLVDEDAQVLGLLHALASPHRIQQNTVSEDLVGMP